LAVTTTRSPATLELANALSPRIGRLVRQLIRETAAAGMSRTQLSVLATLRDGGDARITELADAERVAQPSMTVLVSRLERQGWARRQPDPLDGRAVVVAITPAGASELDRMTAARADVLAQRLEGLTPKEQTALAAALPVLDRLID
jgi:DNA-binding MarR family transcriptional regulator